MNSFLSIDQVYATQEVIVLKKNLYIHQQNLTSFYGFFVIIFDHHLDQSVK